MSTRATYVIDRHAFYIHHDGYPEGAALYFAAMCEWPQLGGCAETFLRANDRAEFTQGHDAHGDTEYRYTYDSFSDTLRVDKRYGGFATGQRWEPLFAGTLQDLLNKYIERADPNDTWLRAFGRTMKLRTVRALANERMQGIWVQFAQGWIGNASGALNDLTQGVAPLGPAFLVGPQYHEAEAKITAAFKR